ncbi:hypothetical protein [Halomonas sp. YLGW01]|uniref:hypothetical protein n=1 Tax=Halomonas sp. YLGW01 TaxID=2773308 RepID=UPI001F5BCED0|nr:hypothetical protein [Halomonas sp. YLGW01]
MIKMSSGVAGVMMALAISLSAGMASEMAKAAEPGLKEGPSGAAMVVDALVARPLLAAATVGGTAVFIVSLPFSALGGNVGESAETLILTPAEAAFRRCLGCSVSQRRDEF